MSIGLYAEGWRKLYQDYQGVVNFVDGDMESLANSIRKYIYIQNPENYNDWADSSEIGMYVNSLCYLGETIHYRVDFNAHDNFPLTTERKQSILNFAKFVSYAPKRLINSKGIAKILQISTTEDVRDSNNQSLKDVVLKWNDAANPNWLEQFLLVLNSAFTYTNPYGKPIKNETIGNIRSHLYQINSIDNDRTVYSFTSNINNNNLSFEVVNADFDTDSDQYIERAPVPQEAFHMIYRTDGTGNASVNTGFYVFWKQGSLQQQLQDYVDKIENRTVEIDQTNINNEDVWVQEIDSTTGFLKTNWTKISPSEYLVYNNETLSKRNLYKVETRDNDAISIKFGDNRFSNIPVGRFRYWYRTSSALNLYIKPSDISNIQIQIPYMNSKSTNTSDVYYLTIVFSVQDATHINQSLPSETLENIRTRSVELYSTQDRMVNGQDYNIYPLKYGNMIQKNKAINRTFSGHSRYIDFNDPTGMYKDVNTIAEDGVLYKQDILNTSEVLFENNGINVENVDLLISQSILPLLSSQKLDNFFYDKYPSASLNVNGKQMIWRTTYIDSPSLTIGYFVDGTSLERVPVATIQSLMPIGTLIRFVNSKNAKATDNTYKEVWAKVEQIAIPELNPDNNYTITVNNVLDENQNWYSDIKYSQFNTVVSQDVQYQMKQRIILGSSFGLTYDINTLSWKILDGNTLALKSNFGFDPVMEDGVLKDPSWILSVQYQAGQSWLMTIRYLEYVFESANNVKFFFNIDNSVNQTLEEFNTKDIIKIFKINSLTSDSSKTLNADYYWRPTEYFQYSDGYIDNSKVKVTMLDSDGDGTPDNPIQFKEIINENNEQDLFFIKDSDNNDYETYNSAVKEVNNCWEILNVSGTYYIKNSGTIIEKNRKLPKDITLEQDILLPTGQILPEGTVLNQGTKYNVNIVVTGVKMVWKWKSEVYANVEDVDDSLIEFTETPITSPELTTWDKATQIFTSISSDLYTIKKGRANIIFQWKHYASSKYVIDPCPTNIIDMFVLTDTYYNEVQTWLKSKRKDNFPKPPTSFELKSSFRELDKSKMISDTMIWHPIQYKLLFGITASAEYRCKFAVIKGDIPTSDNEIKQYVIQYMDEYFATLDAGQKFFFINLSTYIKNKMGEMINTIVPVPSYNNEKFGNLFEITCNDDEILLSTASVDDVQIISATNKHTIKIGD